MPEVFGSNLAKTHNLPPLLPIAQGSVGGADGGTGYARTDAIRARPFRRQNIQKECVRQLERR